jgi:hypothetical protein
MNMAILIISNPQPLIHTLAHRNPSFDEHTILTANRHTPKHLIGHDRHLQRGLFTFQANLAITANEALVPLWWLMNIRTAECLPGQCQEKLLLGP